MHMTLGGRQHDLDSPKILPGITLYNETDLPFYWQPIPSYGFEGPTGTICISAPSRTNIKLCPGAHRQLAHTTIDNPLDILHQGCQGYLLSHTPVHIIQH
jgi:hypothetical protein